MINIPAMVGALFKREEWRPVGHMDYSWTTTYRDVKRKPHDTYGRAVFLVSSKGRRKIETVHSEGELMQSKHLVEVAQMMAWAKGGPLPDNFKPLPGMERKDWKLPEEIRGMFNKEN